MKQTALYNIHVNLGAKMVPFAGYEMPVQYKGINEEHLCVRNSVGIFDVSHMGEFLLRGKNAFKLLQYVTSNDVSKLEVGKAQYSCLPNENGGIVDDIIVYFIEAGVYMMVVNASNIEKDWNWIDAQRKKMGLISDLEMIDISDKTSLLAIQGKNAIKTLQKFCDYDLSAIPYYHCVRGKFNGLDRVVVAATGYTGEPGLEIFFEAEHSEKMWNDIMEAGKEFNIQPIGLGARDTLRLEMGYCLYGNDISDATSPLEAGLGWITKLNKGDFISAEILRKQKENGLEKSLAGFKMIDKGIPRHDYFIQSMQGEIIGKVTSGTQSPCLKEGIGLGYVKAEYKNLDTEINILIRDKRLKAKITKLPFINPAR